MKPCLSGWSSLKRNNQKKTGVLSDLKFEINLNKLICNKLAV